MEQKFPDDWFDLPADVLADWSAIFFLASLSPQHRGRTLGQIFYGFETPLRRKQYHIFRDKKGFARGFTTFAGLFPEAERKFAIEKKPLNPEDWTSGSPFWPIDVVMPFGQTPQAVEKLKSDLPYKRVRTNRIVGDLNTPRVVDCFRREDSSVGLKMYRPEQFEKALEQA